MERAEYKIPKPKTKAQGPSKAILRFPLMLLAMAGLLAALWAGLVRLGWGWPALQPTLPLGHGPLMVSGFFGTLVSLERAVAYKKGWSYLAPLFSGIGGILVGIGVPGPAGPLAMTLGSVVMLAIFVSVLRQHYAFYTLVMGLGAASWLVGNALWLSGRPIFQIVMWWVAFLVITIAGERLELSRMMRLSSASQAAFRVIMGVFLAGLVLMLFVYPAGVRLAGLGMAALGLWLARYDIARMTVRQTGLTRYIAVCLLSGYVWLTLSGVIAALYGGVPAGPLYDAMLHSVMLGFVFGMVFGHAPIIFPAVLHLPVTYRPVMYWPLILLQVSLAGRVLGGLANVHPLRLWSGLLNAIAILLFLALIAPIWKPKTAINHPDYQE